MPELKWLPTASGKKRGSPVDLYFQREPMSPDGSAMVLTRSSCAPGRSIDPPCATEWPTTTNTSPTPTRSTTATADRPSLRARTSREYQPAATVRFPR